MICTSYAMHVALLAMLAASSSCDRVNGLRLQRRSWGVKSRLHVGDIVRVKQRGDDYQGVNGKLISVDKKGWVVELPKFIRHA